MRKLLVMTAVAAVVALVTSGTAEARGRHGGGGGCGCGGGGMMMSGCGYGGCGYGGCGYGGGCGMGGCGFGGGCGMMVGGCGMGGCGYAMGGCGIGGCPGGLCSIGGTGVTVAAAPVGQEAVVLVTLPEDAALTFDDQATVSTSSERVFRTPELEAGKDFHYTLKARYVQDGKEKQVTKTITVRAGVTVQVDLTSAASTETAMAR